MKGRGNCWKSETKVACFTAYQRPTFSKSHYFPLKCGGWRGIRTPGAIARTTLFESAPFDHSGTQPAYVHLGQFALRFKPIGKIGRCCREIVFADAVRAVRGPVPKKGLAVQLGQATLPAWRFVPRKPTKSLKPIMSCAGASYASRGERRVAQRSTNLRTRRPTSQRSMKPNA